MGLDDAGDDIDAFGPLAAAHGQHFEGLADTGRRTEKNLEPAAATAPRFSE